MAGKELPRSQSPVQHTDKRRLSAIAFVDVVGYSRLMGQDERGTVQKWTALLEGNLRPATARHAGTIIKSTGDGVLAEFPSALSAVEWAREVQLAIARAREEDGLVLRISINVGDIIATPEDIHGDSVNIAARLQEHADPGGIIVTEAALALLGPLALDCRDLGILNLKNISRPIRAYALPLEGVSRARQRPSQQAATPSIAVMPLQNLSGDSTYDYFADGVVEDIIVSLGGLRELLVISRGSTLRYRDESVDPRDIGRVLGVKYVLTGSLRLSGNQVIRVAAQLIDTRDNTTLWSDRMETPLGDLFDIQDRIVEGIVAGIAPSVRRAELASVMRRRPDSFSAYDMTLRALDVMTRLSEPTFHEAKDLLFRAMADDPKFAMPVAWAARWFSISVGQGWSKDPAGDINLAAQYALKAIELDRRNAVALATYGHLKSFLFHDPKAALVYLDRAIQVAPSNPLAWLFKGATLSYINRGAEAVEHAEKALRLSPFDQEVSYFYTFLCLAHYSAGNYEEAVKWGSLALTENPSYTAACRLLTAAYVGHGQVEAARQVGRQLLAVEPGFRVTQYIETRQPFRDPGLADLYIAHLRAAGLPD
jgi:adenylate cyclase